MCICKNVLSLRVKTNNMKITIFLVAFCLSGCHNLINENDAIVEKVELDGSLYDYHKYKVYIRGFPTSSILYTNKYFKVGDTINFK